MMFPTENFFEKERRQLFLRRLFRRVFLEDWVKKTGCARHNARALARRHWTSKPTSRRLNSVPLVLHFSNDMEATNSPLKEVDIVVTGDKTKTSSLRSEDLVVSIDLTDVTAGERTIQLTPENINVDLPSGLKIDEIQPNKIAVRLEKIEEREIAVKPKSKARRRRLRDLRANRPAGESARARTGKFRQIARFYFDRKNYAR